MPSILIIIYYIIRKYKTLNQIILFLLPNQKMIQTFSQVKKITIVNIPLEPHDFILMLTVGLGFYDV